MQCPPEPGAALARRLVTRVTIRLMPFRRRQGGIVRRLGRALEPGQPRLKLTDPRQCRFQSAKQRQDEFILLCVAQRAEVDTLRHTELESSRP